MKKLAFTDDTMEDIVRDLTKAEQCLFPEYLLVKPRLVSRAKAMAARLDAEHSCGTFKPGQDCRPCDARAARSVRKSV